MTPPTDDRSRHTTRRGVLRGAVWSTPVVAVAAAAPAFAASPTRLTFTLTQIGATGRVRLAVTGGRNGLSITITNVGTLGYTGIENVAKVFAGGSATFDQTGGTGFYVAGNNYSVSFTYDGIGATLTVPGGGSNSVVVG